MERISSFSVDHRKLCEGIYISRIDGDIVTYDIRVCRPNTGTLMNNEQMHTIEHLFATFIRNGSIADNVIYFGPMGCQTGFYLLVRDSVSSAEVLDNIKKTFLDIIEYDGEVFGKSEAECGNYRSLNLEAAKPVCVEFYGKIKNLDKIITYKEV